MYLCVTQYGVGAQGNVGDVIPTLYLCWCVRRVYDDDYVVDDDDYVVDDNDLCDDMIYVDARAAFIRVLN